MAILVSLSLLVVAVQCQKYQPPSSLVQQGRSSEIGDESSANEESQLQETVSGEQVDKLSSAAGDLYLNPQVIPLDLYQDMASRLQQQRQFESATGDSPFDVGQYHLIGVGNPSEQSMANRGYTPDRHQQLIDSFHRPVPNDDSRNFRALVNDFKHYSRISNPSRESRAFKPRLMSTARGFGKRADRHVTLADLLASANPNGPMATNGKMSANAIR